VLQCVAVRCSVLQCVAVFTATSIIQNLEVWCGFLFCLCVAVCCSVLQCVAMCCSALQCVAVCCSVNCHVSYSESRGLMWILGLFADSRSVFVDSVSLLKILGFFCRFGDRLVQEPYRYVFLSESRGFWWILGLFCRFHVSVVNFWSPLWILCLCCRL